MTSPYFDSQTGMTFPRFNELIEVVEGYQVDNIEQKFTYQDNTLIYQLNSSIMRPLSLLVEAMEATFDTWRLGSAEGRNLEEIARLRGVFRIEAGRSSTSSQYAWLTPSSVIPAGSVFYSTTSKVEAYNPTAVTASTSSCAEAITNTNPVIVEGAVYGFSINGTNYTYTALVADTVVEVHAGIVAELEADTGKTFDFEDVDVGTTRNFIFTANEGTLLNISSLTTKMSITTIKTYFYVECVETGPVVVDTEFMDAIKSPIVGLTSTKNENAFALGRDEETDVELRLRTAAGPLSTSTGTVPTIEAALLTNVANVTLARVIENTNTSPVDADGRPIHSFEVLVDGGFIEQDLLDEIWRVKPAGIETYGSTSGVVTDSSGEERVVSYSTPTQVDIDVEVDYYRYDEETFPDDGVAVMQQAIVDAVNELTIGKDVIADRLRVPIYASVAGVGRTVIRVQDQANPGFTDDKISIAPSEFANTTLGDVTITDLTPPP